MSKRSRRERRRAALSRRIGVRWNGRGHLNRLESIDDMTRRMLRGLKRKRVDCKIVATVGAVKMKGEQ